MERRDDPPDDLEPEARVIRGWLRRADEVLRVTRRGEVGKKGGEKADGKADEERGRRDPG